MSRRKLGQLEAEVLAVLAGADGYLSTSELCERLNGDPAYTTVNTILFRLLDKKMVERSQRGRAFVYRLLVDESEIAAERMFGHLRVASDPSHVLSQFAHGLNNSEAAALRAVLNENRNQNEESP
ncbi:BlaI/MecI/CopY family transcriptional regulator [Allosalinactinospora lopnorensis]|uniref:BlaI/MecI/CopY family transcriptional regulator n=1 Tax=Allosalinactinospora lopnorensis TaxID=1352348 RepID=UPI000623C5C9|nr:BlaI/MecI/CopY family transcriptional regulator [Allosalinactinospora lopnorensis]